MIGGKFVAGALAAIALAASGLAARAQEGRWGPIVGLPLVPSSAAVLKNGKVLFWSADGEFSFTSVGQVYAALYDPATGAIERRFARLGHNMFCTGTTLLSDGRVFMNGGSNAERVSIYDPIADTFTRGEDMFLPRGYNANTILQDGSVLTLGGSWAGPGDRRKDGEIWTPGQGWRKPVGLTVAGMQSPTITEFGKDSHFALIPTGNGRVLYAAPGPMMQWIDTTGSGRVTDAGRRGDDTFASSGNALMYDAGKILKTGGSQQYSGAAASSSAYDIDVSRGAAAVTKLSPMIYPRVYHNSVVLPDGRVFLVGGQTFGQGFQDSDSVMATEIWNPRTRQFSLGAAAGAPRNYHSVALLLPDGRVMSGGGGLCGGCSANHPDFQLYEPSYLFTSSGARASRPVIQSAPASLALGKGANVTTDRAVASFALVRMGATTHTVNADQRRIPVAFTALGGNSYRLEVTSNSGYLLPGQWMLFALDSAGVPSVAKIVSVAPTTVATLVAPDPVALQLNASATITPTVIALGDGVRYSGLGLPTGLSVNALTGQISGAPTESGAFVASLVATRNGEVVSTDVSIIVDARQTNGDGLLGEYFGGAALRGSALAQRREALDFTFGTQGPGMGVPGVFSARWRGSLRPTRGGVTRFRVESDDGVRVWIGGRLIVDDWTAHATATAEGQVDLAQGADHPVFIEYFNSGGPGALRLSWLRPGDADFSVVPASAMFSARPALSANIALGQPATMSSIFEGAAAARAVDGNLNGTYQAGSVAHSGLQDRPWWQVDLGSARQLDYVRIWKRTDCCAERAQNLTVFVSSTDMSGQSYASLAADPLVAKRDYGASVITDFIDVPVSAAGRYVRVQATATTYLNLAEVEVFGAGSGAPTVAAPAAQTTKAGTAVSLAVSASDPDGDALAFSATGLPAGLSIGAANGVISGAPTTPGSYAPRVTVADTLGLTASASFSWTVTGGQPKVVRIEAAPVRAGVSKAYAPEIADGAGASYSWTFGDGTAATAFEGSAATSHVFADPGVYSVVLRLRAADGTITTYGFDQAVFAPGAGTPGGTSSGGSAHQAIGTGLGRLWVVNRDNDSVSAIDLDGRKLTAEIAVGKKPWSLVLTTRNQVWVANRESASISVIDASTLAVVRTIALPAGSRPSDLALVGQYSDVAVTLEATGQIMLVGPLGENWGVGDAGPGPRRIAVNAARDKAYISRFVTPPLPGESTAAPTTSAAFKTTSRFVSSAAQAPVGAEIRVMNLTGAIENTIVLGASDAVDTESTGRGIPNYLGAMAISPDGKSGWVPSKQDNIFRGTLRDGQNLNFQNTVRAIVSRVDLTTGFEDRASRIDVDNAGLVSAVAIHPSGAYLFAALETTRAVAVLDPVGKRELMRIPVGQAPNALTLLPGGRWLAVNNLMDRSVSLIDLQPLLLYGDRGLTATATIRTIGTEKLSATVLKGKQLFYDAADVRLARDGYISCASCHDDGEGDGRTWDLTGFGEGLRNTISLQGHGGRAQGFLHWTGNFDEIQDFEKQIRDLAGGTGLMTNSAYAAGTRAQPLGDRKTGLSADLDALAAYVSSLTVTPASPYAAANGALSSAGQAGKAAFDRLTCATCHGGTQYTISDGAAALRSVGTIKAASGKRLGQTLTRLDVPTLRGVWATAPYLHDGSAPTLQAAIKAHTTLSVSNADAESLAAFLRELGPQ